MINVINCILAQAASGVVPLAAPEKTVIEPVVIMGRTPIEDFWNLITSLGWLQAVVCLAFAIIYIVYGWRVFRALVIINVAMVGMFLGRMAGAKMGSPALGGVMGTLILGAMSWPFMKYCVAVLGAACGTLIGAAAWRACGLPDQMIWAGAMTGIIAGGFLAFSSFKMSIMLFTCMQGSMFLVMGALALLNTQPNLAESLSYAIHGNNFFLPLILITPTFCGIVFQRWLYKKESGWAIPE